MTAMQILWWDTLTKTMPSIQQDMHRVQQNWTLPYGLPKQEEQGNY